MSAPSSPTAKLLADILSSPLRKKQAFEPFAVEYAARKKPEPPKSKAQLAFEAEQAREQEEIVVREEVEVKQEAEPGSRSPSPSLRYPFPLRAPAYSQPTRLLPVRQVQGDKVDNKTYNIGKVPMQTARYSHGFERIHAERMRQYRKKIREDIKDVDEEDDAEDMTDLDREDEGEK
jgi:hypothetical protein